MGFRLLYLLLITLVAACSPVRQAYDKGANRDIRRVAILTVENPDSYVVLDNAAGMFGLIGAVAAVGSSQSRGPALKGALDKEGLRLGDEIAAALESQLRAQGYETVRLPVQRQKKDELLADYSRLETDADAVLDFAIFEAGFVRYAFRPYQPNIVLGSQLVRLRDRHVAYSVRAYYSTSAQGQIRPPAVDGRHEFGSYDDMMKAPALAAASLRGGIEPIARFIVGGMQ